MNAVSEDIDRDVVLLVNDYNPEFGSAIDLLEQSIGKKLRGFVLTDKKIAEGKENKIDATGRFKTIVCDFNSLSSIEKSISDIRDNIVAITCSSERNQPYLKKLLPHLPYNLGPTESSIDWATHKSTMRDMLGSYKPSLVPKITIATKDSIKSAIDETSKSLGYPVIVKPNGLAASILVSKANNSDELETILLASFKELDAVYIRDKGRGSKIMLIEQFIDGDMYSIDAYVNAEGRVWTLPFLRSKTAYTVGKVGFYTYTTESHIELSKDDIEEGIQAVEDAIHGIGLRSCVAHIELFHTINGWKIIELGPRAGGQRHDIYLESFGIHHAHNELLIKCGLVPDVRPKMHKYTSTLNIYADEEGTIISIDGVEQARANKSVCYINQNCKVGDYAKHSTNGGKLLVDGLLSNMDENQLQKDMQLVRSTINIKTKPL